MATQIPPPPPVAGAALPELPSAEVERWRTAGLGMPELLRRVAWLGPVAGVRPDGRPDGRPTVLVTGPEAVQHVLGRHPDRYVKRSHRGRILLGDGVLSASGEAWRAQRRLLQCQFTGAGMRRWEQRIAAAARAAAARWAEHADAGRVVDLRAEMHRFALDTIWRSLTGHPLEDRTVAELGALEAVVAVLPVLPANAEDARSAVAGELARIDAVVHGAIAAARSAPPGPHGPGLLHVLLDAAENRPEYTDRLIRDEFVTLMVAGHETTATTLTWLYLFLAEEPEVRARTLAAGPAGSPERRAALQALVSETLRLYPSAWLLPRHAAEDDLLAGFRVEAGSEVLVCPYLVHRDPGLWPEPEAFDPRRFSEPGRRPSDPGAYLPFGLGARACLGLQFALRETVALLELLLPAFEAATVGPAPEPSFGMVVRPGGPVPAVLTRAG
ncbi:cytochrome P450 [Streptomyces sp. NRRL B-24484]|uniref:cytochrome P450 n=1 Tax=Streptomyces sp. NRRL B-24484 TaxID=1463833 RepID=UPI000A94D875|nr:cytochrome P450 [Streptomyces sp. NRRL B-24484]